MGLGLLLLAALALGLLLWRLGKLGGLALKGLVAALALGVVGYGWQGQPRLAGSPKAPPVETAQADSDFAKEREGLLSRFGSDAEILTAADAMHRAGSDAYAVGLIKGALERNPESADLWVGLGNALTLYAGGVITPPAELAFDRAEALAPGNPAPRYFRGLALMQAGQPERALAIWDELVGSAPADAPWRAEIAARAERLRQLLAMMKSGPAPAP